MKLCMFSPKGAELERGWPGRIDGDRIVQLAAQTLQAFFTGGGTAREHAEYALAECDLRAPVLTPPAVRVFRPFGPGATTLFSFRSPFPVLGPEEALTAPEGTDELSYGLGIAAVIGADGAVAGYTVANDWTACDLARAERAAGFGPSKSCDFGLSLGPVLVTPDELSGSSGRLVGRVNGIEQSAVDLTGLSYPWPELAAHAARNTTLRPGDLLIASAGTGTSALAPGDVVELECEGIGLLRNPVA
ncbi:MAG TPA: fumarylacetoacetate hydrolase family protein [Gaiellaceae bacterium]|jgi:fumarylacetoacetate (FAA) hydrolase